MSFNERSDNFEEDWGVFPGGQIVLLLAHVLEARGVDLLGGVPVHAAAVEGEGPEAPLGEEPLQQGEGRVVVVDDVLHEEELAAGSQHSPDLLQTLLLAPDRAEDEGDHHGVVGGGLHARGGQVLAEPDLEILDVQLGELGAVLVEVRLEVIVGFHGLDLGLPVVRVPQYLHLTEIRNYSFLLE